jgi:hypothetical protein
MIRIAKIVRLSSESGFRFRVSGFRNERVSVVWRVRVLQKEDLRARLLMGGMKAGYMSDVLFADT